MNTKVDSFGVLSASAGRPAKRSDLAALNGFRLTHAIGPSHARSVPRDTVSRDTVEMDGKGLVTVARRRR